MPISLESLHVYTERLPYTCMYIYIYTYTYTYRKHTYVQAHTRTHHYIYSACACMPHSELQNGFAAAYNCCAPPINPTDFRVTHTLNNSPASHQRQAESVFKVCRARSGRSRQPNFFQESMKRRLLPLCSLAFSPRKSLLGSNLPK